MTKRSRVSTNSEDRRTVKTFSECSVKDKMKAEVGKYTKRRVVSQQKVKRKPHYA